MTPHLVKWHEKYSNYGLRIIEVFNGPADRQFGLGVDEIENYVETQQIPFAVLYDNDGTPCDSYGVQGYPSAYLIGQDGSVIWEGCPSRWNLRKVERKLEMALRAAG